MKTAPLILVFVSLSLLTGCAKDEPSKEVYEDDYRFYAKGTASGLPFAYHAGEDNYYLETSYQFKDSVVEMTGRLAPLSNTHKNALEIKIRSQKRLAVASQFEVDKNLTVGEMPLRDATGLRRNSDNYLISLSCDSSGSQYFNHRWVFPDGSYSSDYSLVKMVNINDYKTYPVKLETTGTNCNASVEHHINLADDCDANFEVLVLPNFKAQLILKDTVGKVSEVSWFLNNQSIKPDSLFSTITLGNTGQEHHLKCEVLFADGCIKIIERTLGANFVTSCLDDFTYRKKREEVYDPMQLATVQLTYYDESGKAYSSHYNDVVGSFRIVSTRPYNENEAGQPTTRFFFETEAVLKSSDGSTLELKDSFGSFAVAHP